VNRKKRARTAEIPEIDLSRASPFGPLSQITARRTFAYLIATLNASHPDYDFSHLLRPTDFRKERSLRSLVRNVDSTLYNLRPRQHGGFGTNAFLAPPMMPNSAPAANSFGNEIWGPRMWNLIDNAMGLAQCEKYSYLPQDDPFDGEEGAIWSLHYFFFNKEKKRVCYLYLRALSVISHSPVHAPVYHQAPHRLAISRQASSISVGEGAGKRASYWLGENLAEDDIDSANYDDDDDEMAEPDDDEIEVPYMDLDEVRSNIVNGYCDYSAADPQDLTWEIWPQDEAVQSVRGMSEEIGESMEI
jgi:hypothetical protein